MISVLVSTTNSNINKLCLKKHPNIYYGVIHQVYDVNDDASDCNVSFTDREDVIYKELDYPGLSKSRNYGLDIAKNKYAYIMDDDVDFEPASIKSLVDWMESNDVDVATCQFVYEDSSLSRKYKNQPFKHNMFTAARVASIEICINLEKINKKGIRFDELFGLGTNLPSGEEYIFITDCIRAGLNVWFYPIVTGVHPNITSGMDFFSSYNKVLAKREMFKRVFGAKCYFFIFAFWLKKAPIVYKKGYFFSFTKTLLFGVK